MIHAPVLALALLVVAALTGYHQVAESVGIVGLVAWIVREALAERVI